MVAREGHEGLLHAGTLSTYKVLPDETVSPEYHFNVYISTEWHAHLLNGSLLGKFSLFLPINAFLSEV